MHICVLKGKESEALSDAAPSEAELLGAARFDAG